MKPSRLVLTVVAIASLSAPVIAATINDNALIKQISDGITMSTTVVACQFRTSEWRKSVLLGYFATARLGVMAKYPKASDDQINTRATEMFQAAKVDAALHAQFDAPTQVQCDKLKDSHDLVEMDAAAKIGILFGIVVSLRERPPRILA